MTMDDRADESLSKAILQRIKNHIEEVDHWVQIYNILNPDNPLDFAAMPSTDQSSHLLPLLFPKENPPSD